MLPTFCVYEKRDGDYQLLDRPFLPQQHQIDQKTRKPLSIFRLSHGQ